jgi:putative ABC transport system substrate-binding protein
LGATGSVPATGGSDPTARSHILTDFLDTRAQIATLALANRLPTSCPYREFVVAGGLQSLGASLPGDFRRAANFVDRILKGARPADLPVMQPTKFELVINVKTAGALGLTIPPTMLTLADEVVE